MDREIPDRRRLSPRAVAGGLAFAAWLVFLTSQIPAQERGFGRRGGGFQMPSPEEMFTRMDTNGDGSLSPAEINSNGFLSRFLRDVDTSNGLSRDGFVEAMQNMGGRFGRGDRGGPDSERRRDRGDGDGDRRRRSGDTPGEGNAQPQASGTPSPTTGTASAAVPSGRARVTIDLQTDLLPGDTDRDGQIGLYEWRRFSGRSLREFHELDLNGDGFITPQEYATARPAAAPVAAAPAAQAAPTETAAATPAPATGASGSATPSAGPPVVPADSAAARDAARFFGLLDTNKDGQIAPSEWVDGRIRDMFTKNGIDLSQPLTAADFSSHYVRLSASP